MWMFRRSQTSQEKAVLGSEVFGFLEALNRWSVGDADQAIRKEYGDPIDTIDRGQTGKGPWQACERWLSDKWRGSDGVRKFSGCFKCQAPTIAASRGSRATDSRDMRQQLASKDCRWCT